MDIRTCIWRTLRYRVVTNLPVLLIVGVLLYTQHLFSIQRFVLICFILFAYACWAEYREQLITAVEDLSDFDVHGVYRQESYPSWEVGDAFHNLARRLVGSGDGVFLVGADTSGTGKSTLSLQLAVALRENGYTVRLVNVDTRRNPPENYQGDVPAGIEVEGPKHVHEICLGESLEQRMVVDLPPVFYPTLSCPDRIHFVYLLAPRVLRKSELCQRLEVLEKCASRCSVVVNEGAKITDGYYYYKR